MDKKSVKKVKYRAPCKIPEPENYSNNPKLSEKLELQISKRIKDLEREGVDLAVHSQYLESVVDEQISNCLRELDAQHLTRVDFIKKSFLKRQADKEEFQNFLALIEAELLSTEEEFKTVELLYKKFNPLYDGKIKTDNTEEEMAADE